MSNYIPRLATIAETCEWLAAETGEQWTLPRLLEAALQPWVWLDYSPEHPAIFGDRHEGVLAPFVFMSDTFRLEADRQSALMTMTRTPDDNLLKIAPGLRIALDELRFKREDVTQLAADLRAPAPAAVSAPAKPKRETQADRIRQCVSECEQRAAKHGESFDCERMPGTKAEFLDLLHALDADLRSIKTVDSLDRYLSKAGCKWPLDASAQPSAAPLYARLFPEASIRTPRAVSPQRRKA